jgi:hypothetical protein
MLKYQDLWQYREISCCKQVCVHYRNVDTYYVEISGNHHDNSLPPCTYILQRLGILMTFEKGGSSFTRCFKKFVPVVDKRLPAHKPGEATLAHGGPSRGNLRCLADLQCRVAHTQCAAMSLHAYWISAHVKQLSILMCRTLRATLHEYVTLGEGRSATYLSILKGHIRTGFRVE